MTKKRSITQHEGGLKICCLLLLFWAPSISLALTNPNDVAAINGLYIAFGSPGIPGWIASGGDPCGEGWQGVICNGSDIISLVINAANLGGELGDNLGRFTSIKAIDLSNNQITGIIPSNLPSTLQHFFLSANQLTGSIPESLGTLVLLTDMSLNNNLLSGQLPDVFQNLVGLINLDVSSNTLSGPLPLSLENLSTLTTLHVQNNQLYGTLDVLQDLPLQNLNVENNQFSGPIPAKLLNIPNFQNGGNSFNSTTTQMPPSMSPTLPFSGVPPSPTSSGETEPHGEEERPSGSKGKSSSTKRIVLISFAGVLGFVILVLVILLLLPKCAKRSRDASLLFKKRRVGSYKGNKESAAERGPPPVLPEKGTAEREAFTKIKGEPKLLHEEERAMRRPEPVSRQESGFDFSLLMAPPPPPPALAPPLPPSAPPSVLPEKITVTPLTSSAVPSKDPSPRTRLPLTSVKHYSIAALQQYTESFSQDNLIGSGMLGNVYRAKLPDGKLLAVKKLDKRATNQQDEYEFIKLVNSIDKIRHANIVKLTGYCSEHGQRLLIYDYCNNGSLQDVSHSDDDFKKNLSWNTRIKMALGAARALEYLHEACNPPIVHRNFKSANILLDEDLSVFVSDCGLAPLITSGSVNQLSGQLLSAYGYAAPEFETGIYTWQSDVYCFGVVMLELLTGRKSYDKELNRGEQFLVRWAIPQLHDIDALTRMVDSSLDGAYPAKSLSNFADIISRCVQAEPEFRPLMSEVVQDLLDMIQRERQGSGGASGD